MGKKKAEVVNVNNGALDLESLVKGTHIQVVSESKGVMHDRPNVPTPLHALNCMFGGGLPLGIMAEVYGPPACFVGDTKIMTLDGKSHTIEELYNTEGSLGIYGSTKDGVIVPAMYEDVYLSKYTKELVEVVTDSGKVLCTPDHPFLLRDGTYVYAENLTEGTSLMPICRELHDYDKNDIKESVIGGTHCNHKVVSVTAVHLTIPVPVYGIINAGELHNYALDLGDGQGVIVSNSGKSSFAYQTMGEFQKSFPNGISVIVDTEASVDSARLPFMGCDPSRTLRLPATTIEDGFDQLFKLLDNKSKTEELKQIPVFIVYDTIAVQVTSGQFESKDMQNGAMMAKPKMLKHYLSCMLPYIEQQPITCLLLNQVTTEMTRFGGRMGSSGGWGLKHNIHLKLRFNGGNTEYDGIFATHKLSTVTIEKSKISPLFKDISTVIDITRGGIIDKVDSLVNYCADQLGIISKGSWSNCNPLAEKYPQFVDKFDKFVGGKSFRMNELFEYAHRTPKFVKVLELALLDSICEVYSYQATVCARMRQSIIDEIEAPDPITLESGAVVDSWTGEILEDAPTVITENKAESVPVESEVPTEEIPVESVPVESEVPTEEPTAEPVPLEVAEVAEVAESVEGSEEQNQDIASTPESVEGSEE